jgi:hypothetical protein
MYVWSVENLEDKSIQREITWHLLRCLLSQTSEIVTIPQAGCESWLYSPWFEKFKETRKWLAVKTKLQIKATPVSRKKKNQGHIFKKITFSYSFRIYIL